MSTGDCPCKGCTPETGRAPGCHTKACPRGWWEWDRAHKAEREARRQTDYAESVLATGAARVARERRRSRR